MKFIRDLKQIRNYKLGVTNFNPRYLALGLGIGLAGLLFFLMQPGDTSAAWYDSGWSFRKKLTVDNTKVSGSSNLTDFPVLVSISDNDLRAVAQSDGDDILFTDSDGSTKLSHEIESYSDGTLVAWVKIPTLKYNEDTEFYLYYGNTSVGNQEDAANVWDSNFVGVWHMSEDPSITTDGDCGGGSVHVCDSTQNNNDATNVGGMTSGNQVSAEIDGGLDFEGASDDKLSAGSDASIDDLHSGAFTSSVWVKADTMTADQRIFSPNVNDGWFAFIESSWGLEVHIRTNSTNALSRSGSDEFNVDGQWHLISFTYDNNGSRTARIFIDGQEVSSYDSQTAATGTIASDAAGNKYIGGRGNNAWVWDGRLDEARWSDTIRSDDWIATEYNNQSDPSSFITVGESKSRREPIAHWSFDEGQGQTAYDGGEGSNDGTLGSTSGSDTNDPTWQTEDLCVSSKCLNFDGSNDYVDVGDVQSSGDFSMSFWLRPNEDITSSQSSSPILFTKHADANHTIKAFFASDERGSGHKGALQLGLETDGTSARYEIYTSKSNWNAGEWYHITWVHGSDLSSTKIYVNGIDDTNTDSTSGSHPTGLDYSANFLIGGGNAEFKTGYINAFYDEFKIYPYARSANEVKTDFIKGSASAGAAARFGPDDSYLSDGLVGYWKMDDAGVDAEGETTTDSSGNGNDGTLFGDDGVGDNGTGMDCTVAGEFGTGCDFDGTDDYVDFGADVSDDIESAQKFTLAAWVYNRDITKDGVVIGRWTSSTFNEPFMIWMDTGGSDGYVLGMREDSSTIYKTDETSSNAVQNDWQHVMATWDGKVAKLYVDSVLIDSFDIDTMQDATSGTLRVGMEDQGLKPLDGVVDEVRIYNRAFSPSEASDLYNFAPGPTVYWSFNEGTGTGSDAVKDQSGNSIHGTMESGLQETNWSVGKYGSGMFFGGGSGEVVRNTSQGGVDGYGQFTAMLWVKSDKWDSSNNDEMLSDFEANSSLGGIRYLSGSNRFQADVNVGGTTYFFSSGSNTAPTDSDWHHVTLSYDGADLNWYIDGVETAETSTSGGVIQGGSGVSAGGSTSLSREFEGTIDELRIYNYARTPQQIVEDMNAGHPAPGSPVGSSIGHWKFDEGYGDTAYDSSQQGNNGDLAASGTTCPQSGDSACPSWTNDGRFGKALDFDRGGTTDDYVEVNDPIVSSYPFSVSVWVNTTDTIDDFVSLADDATGNNFFAVGMTSGNADIELEDSGNSDTLDSGVTVNDGNWHHIVAVFAAADDRKIYVDGVQSGTSTNSVAFMPEVDRWNFGRRADSTPDKYLDGQLDEIQIFNSEITADQVKQLYNSGSSSVFGAKSTDSTGNPSWSDTNAYCPPGQGSSCTGPIAEWKFDEGTGTTANDTSENSNTGTISNGPIWSPGKVGYSLDFDGSNDRVNAGSASVIDDLGPMSVSLWINPNVIEAGSHVMLQKGESNGNRWVIDTDGSDEILFLVAHDTTNLRVDSNGILTTGWQHITVTWDGTTNASGVSIYRNGVETGYSQQVDASGSKTSEAADDFFLGNNHQDGSGFKGKIDDIRLYDYERTQAQVSWEFNRGAPVGHWKFDECSGTTANDWAPSGDGFRGNNGTITPGAGTYTSAGTCDGNASSEMWAAGANGKYGASLGFDGDDDYVDLPDISNMNFITDQNDFTVSAWVKPQDASTARQRIVHRTESTTPENNWNLVWDGSGSNGDAFGFGVTEGGTQFDVRSDLNGLSTDNWYHLVGIWKDSSQTVELWLDGNKQSTDFNSTIAGENDGDFHIGTRGTTGGDSDFFQGQIDDVRIYNYALTDLQIKNVYNNSKAVRFD